MSLVNALGNDVANNDTIILLRRIVKLLESNAVVDVANRQRVAIDAALPAGANAIGTVTLGAGAAAIGSAAVSTVAGYDQKQFIDIARAAYGSLRQQLIFT
jgi:hypothetical protein